MSDFYTYENEHDKLINRVKEWESLYYQKQVDLKKMELENEAILKSYLASIRNLQLDIPIEWVIAAYSEQKNKKKSERQNYEFAVCRMKQLFFSEEDEPKLVEIIPYGYESYLYSFIYEINGHTIQIQIPNLEKISVKNMYDMSLGKYTVLLKESESYWECICSSYNAEAVKRDLHKAILRDFKKEEGEINEK